MYTFNIKTPSKTAMININSAINRIIQESQIKSGICLIFIPHSTAGITINENADPDVVSDIQKELNKIVHQVEVSLSPLGVLRT